MSFDIKNTIKDFPILERKIQDNPLTYLDNAASSQKPLEVLNAIKEFKNIGENLANGGVDILIIETMNSIIEIE